MRDLFLQSIGKKADLSPVQKANGRGMTFSGVAALWRGAGIGGDRGDS